MSVFVKKLGLLFSFLQKRKETTLQQNSDSDYCGRCSIFDGHSCFNWMILNNTIKVIWHFKFVCCLLKFHYRFTDSLSSFTCDLEDAVHAQQSKLESRNLLSKYILIKTFFSYGNGKEQDSNFGSWVRLWLKKWD